MFDWLDDDRQAWTFEKLHPTIEIPGLTIRQAEPQNFQLQRPKTFFEAKPLFDPKTDK